MDLDLVSNMFTKHLELQIEKKQTTNTSYPIKDMKNLIDEVKICQTNFSNINLDRI